MSKQREVEEAAARCQMRDDSAWLRWDAEGLRQSAQGPKRKARLAVRLRSATVMSLQRIAEHPAMGSWTNVSHLVGAKKGQESLKSEN